MRGRFIIFKFKKLFLYPIRLRKGYFVAKFLSKGISHIIF